MCPLKIGNNMRHRKQSKTEHRKTFRTVPKGKSHENRHMLGLENKQDKGAWDSPLQKTKLAG